MTIPVGPTMTTAAGATWLGSEGQTLASDVPCRKCGYNLRGLPATGRCPECGTPVGLSVSGDLLKYSDPTWVDGLRRGVNLIILGVVLYILAAIVGIFAPAVAATLVSLLAQAAMFAGWWLLTQPDPSGIGEDRYGRSRQIIRIGLCLAAAGTLGQYAAAQTVGAPRMLGQIVSVLGQVGGLIGLFAELQYLRKIARRIPDDALERRSGFLTYAMGISYGAIIVIGAAVLIAAAMSGARGMGAGLAPLGCAAAIAGIALLVFGIMYLLMVEKFGKRFKEQAAYARQTWAGQQVAAPQPAASPSAPSTGPTP